MTDNVVLDSQIHQDISGSDHAPIIIPKNSLNKIKTTWRLM
jgi:exonuclease III